MPHQPSEKRERRLLMLGTFGMRPKGTMSARAAGIASALASFGWHSRIVTVPWDNPADAGGSGLVNGIEYRNAKTVSTGRWPFAVLEMIREARLFNPDLIYLFKPKGFGDLAARYLRRRGYPVIVDMDDWEGNGGWNDVLPYSRLQRSLFDWQERSWPARASAVSTASQTLRQRAIGLDADPSHTLYLPNGLSDERLRQLVHPPSRPSQDYPTFAWEDTLNVLLYTRFVEFDPRFVVQVMRDLVKRIPNVRLVVAGASADGSAEQRLTRAARRSGISDRIENLGWIPSTDLGWIAGNCAAALVPFDDSLINRAKCSVKVLELMACGLPVVASAVGENREYLGAGQYGLLATPHDAESHVQSLVTLLGHDPSHRRTLGEGARHRACTSYRWEALVGPVAGILDTAVTAQT